LNRGKEKKMNMKDLDSIKAYENELEKEREKGGGGVVEQRKKQDRA
jgi:hypothetical protein